MKTAVMFYLMVTGTSSLLLANASNSNLVGAIVGLTVAIGGLVAAIRVYRADSTRTFDQTREALQATIAAYKEQLELKDREIKTLRDEG